MNKSALPDPRLLTFLAFASLSIPIVAIFSGVLMAGVMPLISVIGVLYLIVKSPELPRYDRPFLQLLLLFFVWALASSAWSIIPARTLDIWSRISLLTFLGLGLLTFARTLDLHQSDRIHKGLLIGLITALVLAFVEAVMGYGIISWIVIDVYGRAHFNLVDLNRGACVLALMVWPGVLAAQRMGYRKMAWALPVLAIVVLGMLDSLAAFVALSAGFAMWIIMRLWSWGGMRLVVYGLPLALMLWPVLVGSVDWPAKLNNGLGFLPESAKHRVMIWDFTYDHMMDRPWLGWGMDAARQIPGGTATFKEGEVYLPLHPHNIVLQIGLELGVIGLAIFLGMLWCMLRALAKSGMDRDAKHIALILAFTYIAIAMPAFGVWQSWWLGMAWLSGSWVALLMGKAESRVHSSEFS